MERMPADNFENEKWAHLRMAPIFFAFVFLFSACDLLKPKGQAPADKAKDQGAVERSADPSNSMLTQGERFAFHRWLVKEMLEQVFGKAAKSATEVDAWANVFSQRGSMEGVYHGMVLSSEYSALEQGKTDMKAVRFFAQEMAAMDHPNAKDTDEAIRKSAEDYAKKYMAHSLFTLKRLLGDRVISESVARKGDKDQLAAWYASFVGRWSKAGVSFGMAQRDNPNEAFHFKWAQENTLGMVQWELLNRLHRILNNYGGLPPIASTSPAGK